MLRSINLNNQFHRQAGKIRDVRPDRNLPPEMTPLYIKMSEMMPKERLCTRYIRS
ncbi:hypothetical protein OCAR_6951 [Afipia carboxidovorans OM5]|nr:hypothetical protein OCAR_6951 [Afipia carboxidovorans OM5]